jgi:hypothetical protein
MFALEYHVDHPCVVIRGSTEEDIQGKGEDWKLCCLLTSIFENVQHDIEVAEDSRAGEYCRHTSSASKASRATAEKSTTGCVCVAKAASICCRAKSCSCTEQDKIRVSDGFALISKVPQDRISQGGCIRKTEEDRTYLCSYCCSLRNHQSLCFVADYCSGQSLRIHRRTTWRRRRRWERTQSWIAARITGCERAM